MIGPRFEELGRDESRDERRAATGHEISRLVVEENAMLDGVHAGTDGVLHPPRIRCMRGHRSPASVGRVDACAQFFLRVLNGHEV